MEKLLTLEGMTFIKIVKSSKKVEVVQIDKNKYKDMRNLVEKSFWLFSCFWVLSNLLT